MTNPHGPQEAPMLVIAYPRDAWFLRLPFHVELDPELVEMDRVLDDQKLALSATNDLLKSASQAAWNGRKSTPVVITLQSGVVRRLMDWSYRTQGMWLAALSAQD